MLYDHANAILQDVSTFSIEAREFLEEERYRSYIPVENINPSTILVELIPVIIDELADYGIVVQNDPADIAENGLLISGFFRCIRYLLPNGIQPMIRNDNMLLSLYEATAEQYSTLPLNIVTNILTSIGAGDNPYVQSMRNACIDVLDNLDIRGTGQYADTIINMCDIVKKAQTSDMSDHLEYIHTVYTFHSQLTAYFKDLKVDIPGWDAYSDRLHNLIRQLVSIMTSKDVMDNYSSIMFRGAPHQLNLDVPVLALSPLLPSYWNYHKQPIGGGDYILKLICDKMLSFVHHED